MTETGNAKDKLVKAKALIGEALEEFRQYDLARFRPVDVKLALESGEALGQLSSAITSIEAWANYGGDK